MRRLILLLAGTVALVAPVAAAKPATTIPFAMSEHGPYACLGPCATAVDFVVNGTVTSKALGTMTVVGIGHITGKPDARNCITQSERWGFTSTKNKGQDSIEARTTGDKICFAKDFSTAVETSGLRITGGTGRFKNASGAGQLKFHVLSSPQKGSGTITGTLNMP